MSRPDASVLKAADLIEAGRHAQAEPILRRRVQSAPGDANANRLLALVLVNTGKAAHAEFFARRAVDVAGDASSCDALGTVLAVLGKADDAAGAFRRGLSIDPAMPSLHNGLGNALFIAKRYDEAAAAYAEACGRMPTVGAFWRQRVSALAQGWRIDEALVVLREAVAAFPDEDAMKAHAITAGVGYASGDPREVFEAHRAMGRTVEARGGPRPAFTNPKDASKPLRVALLSADWREHPVSHFIRPLLIEPHPGLEVVVYDATKKPDGVSRELRALVRDWREVASIADAEVAARMRRDAIDVVVDLGGYTLDSRVAVLAHHAAPVQVTYLGYAGTTGMTSIGWRLVDGVTDPPGAERWCTERLLRMEGCFLCFTEPPGATSPARPPCVVRGGITFGSFNNLTKVTPTTIRLWAGVLARVPQSRLVLKGPGLDLPTVRSRVVAALEAAGVARERVECLASTPAYADHLAAYARVDVALDTFPYHGTTTTCEALWMGVPVVTLAGELHASRVGVSLLHAAGLSSWVASTEAEYVEIAAGLAADPAGLSALRPHLRDRMGASPLGDAPGYVGRFEAALRRAWTAWCAGD